MIALLAGRQHLKEEWIKKLVQHLSTLGEVYDFSGNLVKPQDIATADLVIDFNTGVEVPADIPHLIIDFGFLERNKGYMQVVLGELNNIVKAKVNSNRDLLKVESGFIKPKAPILVLGQKENDRQHKMSGKELKIFYKDLINKLKKSYPDNQIWFRNHPDSKHSFVFNGVTNKDNVIIDELYGVVGALATYNSTGALPFLAQGVPVFCHKKAFYNDYCMSIEDIGCELFKTSREERGLLFSQIAHSQFTKQELSKPELINTLIEYAKTKKVPEEWLLKKEEIKEDPITQQQFELACEALETVNFPKARKMVKQVFPEEKFKDRGTLDAFCKDVVLKFKMQGSL